MSLKKIELSRSIFFSAHAFLTAQWSLVPFRWLDMNRFTAVIWRLARVINISEILLFFLTRPSLWPRFFRIQGKQKITSTPYQIYSKKHCDNWNLLFKEGHKAVCGAGIDHAFCCKLYFQILATSTAKKISGPIFRKFHPSIGCAQNRALCLLRVLAHCGPRHFACKFACQVILVKSWYAFRLRRLAQSVCLCSRLNLFCGILNNVALVMFLVTCGRAFWLRRLAQGVCPRSGLNLGRNIFRSFFWSLVWHVDMAPDSAGSHKVCVRILCSIWAAAFSQ